MTLRRLKLRTTGKVFTTLPSKNVPMAQVDEKTWVEILPGQSKEDAVKHFIEAKNRPRE